MPEELNILEITSTDLENWSKAIQSRAQLPRLIRMLILETNPKVSKCYMPYGEDIGRPGYDGEVISPCEERNVPVGVSYWEMGTNEEPQKKAEDDYNKRRKKVQPEEAKNITFVFVTPKKWVAGDAWAKKKAEEHFWRNVCVIDACNLSCWINEHPIVKLWMSRVTEKMVLGFRHLEWAWDEWRNACRPPLPSSLFELEIIRHKRKFLEWLNQQDEYYLDINADSKEEAFAFLYTLLELDEFSKFRNKVIIADGQDHIDFLSQLVGKGVIPIIHDYQMGKRLCPNSSDVHIIRICPQAYDSHVQYVISLSSLSTSSIEEVVKIYESNTLRRNNIIRNSCYSRTVLRRLLSFNPNLKEPAWINDSKVDIECIIPLLFCGYWQIIQSDDNPGFPNKEFIQTLYKKNDDELYEIYEKLIDIANFSDSPIWYSSLNRNRYVNVKSREETLRTLIQKNLIKRNHWERFRDAAITVFNTIKEPANSCHTLSPRFFILRTCILIDINSDSLFERAIYKPNSIRKSICETIFSLPPQRFFSDNSRFLNLIAESWPNEYLCYLKDIFESEVNCEEPLSEWSWELVQSIACLAINPEYYEQATCLLVRVYALIDCEQAKEVIYNLFCWWHPQTNASTKLINDAAKKMATANHDLAWYIGARQFKQDGDWTLVNNSGALRGGDWQIPEKYRDDQCGRSIRQNWEDIIKKWKHATSSSIIKHINIISALSDEAQEISWESISNGIKMLNDDERVACHMCIRKNIRTLKERAPEKQYVIFSIYKRYATNCIKETQPQDSYIHYSWYFLYETQRLLNSYRELNKSEKRVLRLARCAIKKLLADKKDDFLNLIRSDKTNCCLLGKSLALELSLDKLYDFLVSCAQDSTVEKHRKASTIDAIVRNISSEQYEVLCDNLYTTLSPDSFLALLLCMPWTPHLQSYIDKLPNDLNLKYWKEASFIFFDEYEDAIGKAITGLLSVSRADKALHAMAFKIYKKQIIEEERHLLVNIMEKLCRQPYMAQNISHDIEQCLNLLENYGTPLEKLAHWELHYLTHQRNPEEYSKRLSRLLWKNPFYAVRLFKRCMAIKSDAERSSIRNLYSILHKGRHLFCCIPERFSFESWIKDIVE